MRGTAVLLAAVALAVAASGVAAYDWTGGTVPEQGTEAGPEAASAVRRLVRARATVPAPRETAEDEADGEREGCRLTYVRGRVTDQAGGPIDEARVSWFVGTGRETVVAKTDDSGAFSARLDEATGVVRWIAWAERRAVRAGEWMALADGDDVDVGTIRLSPAARITGRILDPEGERETGTLRIDGSEVFGRETWALIVQATGLGRCDIPYLCSGVPDFSIDWLPAGRYRLEPDVYHRSADAAVVAAPADEVIFRAGEDDRPAPFDVELSFVGPDGEPADTHATFVSVADGSYVWIDGRKGRGVRITRSSGRTEVYVDTADGRRGCFDVTFPGGAVEVRLEDRPVALTICGRVTSRGAPLTWTSGGCRAVAAGTRVTVMAQGAESRVSGQYATTDEDGTFRIGKVYDDEEWDVWAEVDASADAGPRLASAHVRVRAGADGVTLDLPVGLTRRFRIVWDAELDEDSLDTGIESPDDGLEHVNTTRSDDEIVVTGLRPFTTYSLVVRAKIAGEWTCRTRVDAFSGVTDEDAEPVVVRLAPALRISGRVIRGDGTSVVGAQVIARSGDDDGPDAVTGLDGRFTLTGVEPGSWTLSARAPGLGNDGAEPVVPAGAADVTLVVR